MKIEIKFAKHLKKPEDVKRLMQLEDISQIILDIIDDKKSIGRRVVNYKGDTIFTIKFK